MKLFSTQQSFLGIDFDSNSVKIVELKNENNRPRLVTYGYYDRNLDSAEKGKKDAFEDIPIIVKRILGKAKTTSAKVITSLPAYSVFSSILNLPVIAKKDLASAINWEAKKVIPLALEEMILDWKVLEQSTEDASPKAKDQSPSLNDENYAKITEKNKSGTRVLLTAAPKDLVKKYIDIFNNAGLTLLSLDTESFALIRALVGNDKSALMIVDIGSVVTNITIIDKGIPMLNRSIDVGGLSITTAIANSLSISVSRAEQLKYDIGIDPEKVGQGNVPKTIEGSLRPIVDEIRYSLNLYKNQGQSDIEKIILTGGSSLLARLPQYLEKQLEMRVFLGNPWARVVYPEELKPVLDEIGPRFAVAVGLAMRDIE